ncbi:cbb3-type cytochrome oxidase assembly protein CcoS [Conchiformibius steedae DSM 2580]|uniref:Cbb3-type cytochrome oxidase assembly protein CcoS n=2 Tax=Conchiformibius steedae TaxID=153493 RepID=A0A3P2A4E4_9NEIS|nr:cbb3-type cytochrome oxidase assembly protein CcoS [Conchiformibius steedae]QMT33113.1 cbb3-type cytochrome oxidase assembly protein CcoS [Conchiformibius steedae]RRD90322.1 cbb3-type cytochrome oxidase assembly protein CcoS [Conchiformibius steedae]URD67745.1 cbb3-type cytochrome oxidase assembly protein CcoS [Conchiformibius steedae DSM 2580]
MESLYILIPISILLAFVMAYFFWWSGKSGQFDDLEGPAHRIIMDDDTPAAPPESADKEAPCQKSD